MLTGVNIPDELIPEILSYLPPKSLGKFKCVSKPWKTLISNPKFIQFHLTRYSYRHRQSVVISTVFKPLVVVDFHGSQFYCSEITSVLEFGQMNGWLTVCGSIDGLVLGLNAKYELCLVNCTIKEFKKLPVLNAPLIGVASGRVYGFGFDCLDCDYKVVMFSHKLVWVYSLKNNVWKMVKESGFNWLGSRVLHSDVGDSGFFVNGGVHLLGRKNFDSDWVIVAFDLSDEKFKEVPKPSELMGESLPEAGLEVRVLGGFLCLTNGTTDIWVMKEYGVKESWLKFSIYQPRSYHIRPVLLSGDEDSLLFMNQEKFVVYNVKENTSRDIECCGLSLKRNFEVRTFVSSLVSPKQWD